MHFTCNMCSVDNHPTHNTKTSIEDKHKIKIKIFKVVSKNTIANIIHNDNLLKHSPFNTPLLKRKLQKNVDNPMKYC